jgi:Mn2+/Fe2+ NRAMP family transporter
MKKIKEITGKIGPGFIIAATGIGAGDMVAATVAGAKFGTIILWASILGALFKYVLNEGLARWQLGTGTTVIEGWFSKFKPIVGTYFILYLVLWSFIVSGALMAACGLAAHAIFPQLSVAAWGIIHSILALSLVLIGKYRIIETIMKVFISIMFVTIIANLFFMEVDWLSVLPSMVIPRIPSGSIGLILGVIGGVGGSVTILSYGYWLREKGWNKPKDLPKVRFDLGFAYVLTGIFGAAIIILSAGVTPEIVSGSKIVLGLANKLEETIGIAGKWIFLTGFWGAVFSSMLGVYDGIPYMFNDFVNNHKKSTSTSQATPKKTKAYRFFLFFLAIPPMLLLFVGKPVWIIVIYSISGAFFMPFVAAVLLYMNSKKEWLKGNSNSIISKILLTLILLLFVALLYLKVKSYF